MEQAETAFLRGQLLERRDRLASALSRSEYAPDLVHLLQEVDSALVRMDSGTFGLCEHCHDPIENYRLEADPLIRFCLDHLTPDQRQALQQDLELAARIQTALLPSKNLRLDGWEICYQYVAAGAVSGDYCDVVNAPGDSGDVFFLLGDVSGKGVASSILMSHLHAVFRTLLADNPPLRDVVARANRIFCESTLPQHYATLVCGRASRSGKVEICNAGHCPPLLSHGSSSMKLEATGLPLGLFCSGQYTVQTLHLDPGQSLLIFTDGLTEARNNSGAEYGPERLAALMAENGALPPSVLASTCLKDLTDFRSGAPVSDDVTVMVIQRTAPLT